MFATSATNNQKFYANMRQMRRLRAALAAEARGLAKYVGGADPQLRAVRAAENRVHCAVILLNHAATHKDGFECAVAYRDLLSADVFKLLVEPWQAAQNCPIPAHRPKKGEKRQKVAQEGPWVSGAEPPDGPPVPKLGDLVDLRLVEAAQPRTPSPNRTLHEMSPIDRELASWIAPEWLDEPDCAPAPHLVQTASIPSPSAWMATADLLPKPTKPRFRKNGKFVPVPCTPEDSVRQSDYEQALACWESQQRALGLHDDCQGDAADQWLAAHG